MAGIQVTTQANPDLSQDQEENSELLKKHAIATESLEKIDK